MPNTKKIQLVLLLVVILVCSAVTGQAAEKSKAVTKAPIVVEGDEVYFNDSTGDLFARGNVVISQDQARVLGDLMRGNAKQNEIWIDGKATFIQPETNLVGMTTHYNYGTQTGSMLQATGKVGRELIAGQQIEFLPGKVIIHNGTETGCPAKIPDYHVSADRIEIWPGDKMIAYNAKFWIKSTEIFSMSKYQKSLLEGAESDFPSMGYTSKDGFYVKQHLEYPVNDKASAFVDLGYYSKRGFKPIMGANYREGIYSLSVVDGWFRDGNSNWIKKEPEFDLTFGHKIGDLPISYSVSAVSGKWTDSLKTSWHQDYSLYFSGDPIKLGDKSALTLGTGLEKVMESFDGSTSNVFRYDATLSTTWTDRFSTSIGYHFTRNNDTLFAYGTPDLGKEFDTGFTYKIDKMNSLGFNQSYDMTNHRVFDQDYFWYRDLHCWTATIEYRARRHQTIVEFAIKHF